MKKYLKSAITFDEFVDGKLYDVAHRANYDIMVDKNNDIVLLKEKYNLPEIKVRKVLDGRTMYLEAELTFPKLNTEEFPYYDGVASILDDWAKIGNLITAIKEFSFDAEDLDQ